MNEQLQNTINVILQKAIDAATSGAEFIKGEIPDVVQQLLTWKLMEAILGACTTVVAITIFIFIMNKWWKSCNEIKQPTSYFSDDASAEQVAFVISSFFGLGGSVIAFFVGFIANIMEAVKIFVAPKVWLIEYAAALVK